MSYQQDIFALVAQFSGQNNIIAVPRLLCEITGSLEAGTLLSQMLFWSDKGSSNSGWFFKSYREWNEEIFLTEYQVRKITKQFEEFGILETVLRKAQGSPTLHYRVKRDEFSEWILKFLRNRDSLILKNPNLKIQESLTEITTETTNTTRVVGPDHHHHSTRARNAQPDADDLAPKSLLGFDLSGSTEASSEPPPKAGPLWGRLWGRTLAEVSAEGGEISSREDPPNQPPVRTRRQTGRASPKTAFPPPAQIALCPEINLRQAAWELGLALFGDGWAGYSNFVGRQPLAVVILLLGWLAFYADLDYAQHNKIKSVPGVVRAHLQKNEVADLRQSQRDALLAAIARASPDAGQMPW